VCYGFVITINSDSEFTHFVNVHQSALLLKAIPSVCPSVNHNYDPGLNGLRCRNT